MRRDLLACVAAMTLALGIAGTAEAGLLQIRGGDPSPAETDNKFVPWAAGFASNTNTMELVTTQDNVTLTFQYINADSWAGYNNTFTITGGGTIEETDYLPVPVEYTHEMALSTIPFFFTTGGGTTVANASAGSADTSFLLFFVGACDATAAGGPCIEGDQAYIALDDGGHDNKDNHDDMIVSVRAQVTEVPEPATLVVLGVGLMGLGGLGFATRRRFFG